MKNFLAKIFFICFIISMKVHSINQNLAFRTSKTNSEQKNIGTTQSVQSSKPQKKQEFIDSLLNVVRNQSDINDCVAVPRGIFKAYLWIMAGFGLIGIAGALSPKFAKTKTVLSVIGNVCNMISAFFFAKPFAFKGVSPTVKPEDLKLN